MRRIVIALLAAALPMAGCTPPPLPYASRPPPYPRTAMRHPQIPPNLWLPTMPGPTTFKPPQPPPVVTPGCIWGSDVKGNQVCRTPEENAENTREMTALFGLGAVLSAGAAHGVMQDMLRDPPKQKYYLQGGVNGPSFDLGGSDDDDY